MPLLEVRLFGGIRVCRKGQGSIPFRSQKAASLLAYLALHRGRLHSRVELATFLWPEQDEARGRANLRTTLHHLKQTLTPTAASKKPSLLVSTQTIGFNPESNYWLDVEEFDRLLTQAAKEKPKSAYDMRLQACELYCGDLLAGHYEDWGQLEQERLRLRYLQSLQAVADHEANNCLLPQAIDHLRLYLTISPLEEPVHRKLIKLFIQQGDTASAWRQYRLCERLLLIELGVPPDPKTMALRGQLHPERSPQADPAQIALEQLEHARQAYMQRHDEAAARMLQSSRRQLASLHLPEEADALLQLGQAAIRGHDLDLAQQRFTQAQAVACRAQNTAYQALALNGLGATESARGHLDKAREDFQRALRLAERGHHTEVRWKVLNNLGRNHWRAGRYDEALQCYVMVQLLCDQLSDRRCSLIVLQNMGTLYSYLGLFEEAHRCYREAQSFAEAAADTSWLRSLWHNWGDVYLRQGDHENAEQYSRNGYQVSWNLGDDLGCAANLSNLGQARCALGDFRGAQGYLAKSLRKAKLHGFENLELESLSALASVQLAQGNLTQACDLSSRAMELLDRGVLLDEPARIYLARAMILRAMGDHNGAKQMLETAWRLVTQRADLLKREDFRRSLLENIPLHKQIQALLKELSKHSSTCETRNDHHRKTG